MRKLLLLIALLTLFVTACSAAEADSIGWVNLNTIGQHDSDNSRIINVAEPTEDTDGVNKQYVDDAIAGITNEREAADGTGGYWHEYSIGAIDLSPGASGATLIAPNASSLGGYQFNNITEYLFFVSHIDDDWDGISDGVFEIYFEVNDDNTGGLITDTVKFQLETWHKIPGELANTVYSLAGNTVVGQSSQHELFVQTIAIENLRDGDVLAFRLNLNTIQSQVTDVIVNMVEFKYPTYIPAMERN